MSIKKRLGLGAMSAVMGISLIGTGTWAAFNDIESANAIVGAGELNLLLGKYQDKSYEFLISDLKPGDEMTREIVLKNDGTLAIKDVLMAIELVDFEDYIPNNGDPGFSAGAGANGALAYLDQFRVSVIKVGSEGGGIYPLNLIGEDKNITLKDFYLASDSINGTSGKTAHGATSTDITTARQKVAGAVNTDYIEGNRLNVSSVGNAGYTGLPLIPKDDDRVQIKVQFVNKDKDEDKVNGLFTQNIFQGDKADIKVSFEARQWGGLEVKDSDMENSDGTGDVKTNKKANSQTN
jgi:spore coat-associated protein N